MAAHAKPDSLACSVVIFGFMHSRKTVASALASVIVCGSIEIDEIVERGSQLLGRRWRWLRPLAGRISGAFPGRLRPRKLAIEKFILNDRGFVRAFERYELRLHHDVLVRPTMHPIDAARAWGVYYPLSTLGELAEWLGLTANELSWFADLRRLECQPKSDRRRHYRYRTLTKKFGQIRLIEAPKPRLKKIQQKILSKILDQVPPHFASHGFRKGRSIKSFAKPHAANDVVLKLDLFDFFPTVRAAQVRAIFRSIGYPEDVSNVLAGLCTNSTPSDVWDNVDTSSVLIHERTSRYSQPHLPQGAPTSPALANLSAYRMDCRLNGLAQAAGANYTRYADDLAFSGNGSFGRAARNFQLHASAIAMEEGFRVHHRKTRIMGQGVQQRLAGIVVNQKLNICRNDFDRLKATLTNCIRLGVQTQNRENHDDFRSHLHGKVSFVEMINPDKGRRLRELFDEIIW